MVVVVAGAAGGGTLFCFSGDLAVYGQELQLPHPKRTPLLPDLCFTDAFPLLETHQTHFT